MLEPIHEKTVYPKFEDHVQDTLMAFRGSLADLLDSVHADPTKPQEISRRFGLNRNLSWKLSRIVCETDPIAAIPHIPGTSGLKIVIKALEKAGAPSQTVQAFRKSIQAFDQMVAHHAGDRTTLEMMLGNLTRNGEGQRSESFRKLAYQGNRAVLGVQAKTQITVNLIAPSQDNPDRVDLAWLSGLVELRRLRHNVPWAIASAKKFETNGTEIPVGHIEALDPDFAGPDEAPLMGKFCSNPLPDVRPIPQSEGMLRYELSGGTVGNPGAATCLVGLFGKAFITRYKYGVNTLGEHIARMSTPVELLVHDLYVHKALDYALKPEIALYSQLPGGPTYPQAGRDQGLLPSHEKVHPLGSGLAGVAVPEVPRYKQMIGYVHERLGWNPDEFLGFRFKLSYPFIPSMAVLRYLLPEK